MGSSRSRTKVIFLKRGEVYLVDFDPVVGAEITKRRPALIIQNDIGNRVSPITIVAAFGSRIHDPLYPFEVLVRAPEGGLAADSTLRLNQIRTMDKARLVKRLGRVAPTTLAAVDTAIKISLGLIPI